MKKLLLLTSLITSLACSAQLPLGENPGYYGPARTDQQIYDLMYTGGARSTRSTVSLQYVLQYGMATFQARLQYPALSKGMTGNTFNLTATAGPTYTGQSDSMVLSPSTGKMVQSWIPSGIYNPGFNSDGSINTANVWAKYCYDVVQSIGPYFSYFEVWNEPDLTGNWQAATLTTAQFAGSWQTNEPAPGDLTNLNAPVADYVQLCKIANQVIKKYQPNAKICTGGLGYPWFYQWFLHDGGGQWVDDLSFHIYPYFDWVTNTMASRNSDFAMNDVLARIASYRQIETQAAAPHLPVIMTESNIPRWSYVSQANLQNFPNNKPWGNDTTQRNYTIKLFAKLFQAGLQQAYLYQTGETGDSGMNNGSTGSEIDAMGMYKNLTKAAVGAEVLTDQGIAMQAMQSIFGKTKVNTTLLPVQSGSDGVEFDSSGIAYYLLWPVTTTDLSEKASAVRNLPPGEYDVYDWKGKHNRICGDTIHLTEPVYCKPKNTALAIYIPPYVPPVVNDIEAEVFPSPNNGTFNITIGSKTFGGVLITVWDMYGRLVKTITGTKDSFYYQVKNISLTIPAAIYAVKININGSQEIIKKIIIIK